MLKQIAAKSGLLITACLIAAMFAQSVQSSPERVQVVRQAGPGSSAAVTGAAYYAPFSTASQSRVTEEESSAYDFIIKNGRIIDGAGNPWVSGDVAIRGARIAKIGKLD